MAIGIPRFESPAERRLERSGSLNEGFVFGRVRTDSSEYQADAARLIRRTSRHQPIILAEAVELVKRYQPFIPGGRVNQDPRDPVGKFPNALRQAVARRLGHNHVYFWTGVDSILDKNFAADAVIELAPPGEEPCYVRLDASIDPDKLREYALVHEEFQRTGRYASAEDEKRFQDRVLIGEVPDAYEEPTNYRKFVEGIVDDITEKLGVQLPAAARHD